MLRTLAIRNVAIIDALDLEFGPGLNVLTGETGAGKSIIVGALNLVLGGRTGAEVVRAGATKATADATFEVPGLPAFLEFLAEAGYEAPDGELLLTREVQDGGRSVARINGRPATVAQLREIGEWLVDLHGQHEHQSLLNVRKHMELLDAWGGQATDEALAAVRNLWQRTRDLQARLQKIERDARERLRLMDLYRYQVQEIASARLRPGEEEELQEEALRLRNVERLREAALRAVSLLRDGETSAADSLAAAASSLADVAAIEPEIAQTATVIRSLSYELEEAARGLTRYLDRLEADPERLDAVERRLAALAELKRKYGSTIEEVMRFGEEAAQDLAELEQAETVSDELRAELSSAEAEYRVRCEDLSDIRRRLAHQFEQAVTAELADVALAGSVFQVHIEPAPPGPLGADAVEFLFTANAGEAPRPLARIASGGEISRVMLAIKSAAASKSALPTMVFDEVDAGIGGRAADAIATRLRTLSRTAQVLCITHLAPIAAAADVHYAIGKHEQSGRAVVTVKRLIHEDRVEELARMLAGNSITDAVRAHVRTLLARGSG